MYMCFQFTYNSLFVHWNYNFRTECFFRFSSKLLLFIASVIYVCTLLLGFVPKELFESRNRGELRNVLCSRCYFLKYHKMVLNVRVSPEDYPKLLSQIKDQKALVMLAVDLLDVPCSVWPGLLDVIGKSWHALSCL